MRLEIGTERGMHAALSFHIHLHASMGSTAAAGWSRQGEDAAAQCDSLCSAASTVSSLSMLLCDGHESSVSSAATPAGASFSWECTQHGDSFGGKLNGLRSWAGQQRSYLYGKASLAARASSPPSVQGCDDIKSLHHYVPPSCELECRRGCSNARLRQSTAAQSTAAHHVHAHHALTWCWPVHSPFQAHLTAS